MRVDHAPIPCISRLQGIVENILHKQSGSKRFQNSLIEFERDKEREWDEIHTYTQIPCKPYPRENNESLSLFFSWWNLRKDKTKIDHLSGDFLMKPREGV